MIAILGCLLIAAVLMVLQWVKLCFYRAYFEQKQRNLGKNPNDVLRAEFGWWWWILR